MKKPALELKWLEIETVDGATANISLERAGVGQHYRYEVSAPGARDRAGTATDPVDAFRAILALLAKQSSAT